jgi:hypothetical protein
MMPISRTPMISALSGGLALNAIQDLRVDDDDDQAHRIRKTSIRTRKMRGEETLKGSMSCAMPAFSSPKPLCLTLWHRATRM